MNTNGPGIVKISSGFFYRTNKRGQRGLNWARNVELPLGIRNCPHAINLGRHFVEGLPLQGIVEATIWQQHPNAEREFKGIFRVEISQIYWWKATNDYYTANSGTQWLAVPTILWRAVKLPEPALPNQRTLF